jgi:membrane protein DedA with SNARE-associated domain
VFAAIVDIPAHVGYSLVFALIAVETMGIPVPGETALIAAALLAHDGEMNIVPLIALAAAAAIIGDNVGFAIGRKGGRRLFLMPGPFHQHRLAALAVGEPFFKRHGPKAVFLGRWVAGLRIASAWLAGMNKMDWPTFLFWNALGGIAWATSIGLGVYFVGHAFEQFLGIGGIVAAGVVSGALVGLFVFRRVRARRRSGLGDARVPEPEG